MSSNKVSIDSTLRCAELAQTLRQMADDIDSGKLCVGEMSVDVHGDVELRTVIKSKKLKHSWEIRLKGRDEGSRALVDLHPSILREPLEAAETPAAGDLERRGDDAEPSAIAGRGHARSSAPSVGGRERRRPSYKSVKKRMSKDLKAIRLNLRNGQLPDRETSRSFIEDCHLITTYRSKGDEQEYSLFRSATERLASALDAGDVSAALESVAALKRREKACHAKYK